jgi:uncharacterized protein (TIGR03067 family)
MKMRLALLVWATVLTATATATSGLDEELARHEGTWRVLSFVRDGVATPEEIATSIVRVVEKDHVVWKREGKSFAGTRVRLDPSTKPASLDVIPDGGPNRDKPSFGIYKLAGGTLTICMADQGAPRPKEFKAEKGSRLTLMVFERLKPK